MILVDLPRPCSFPFQKKWTCLLCIVVFLIVKTYFLKLTVFWECQCYITTLVEKKVLFRNDLMSVSQILCLTTVGSKALDTDSQQTTERKQIGPLKIGRQGAKAGGRALLLIWDGCWWVTHPVGRRVWAEAGCWAGWESGRVRVGGNPCRVGQLTGSPSWANQLSLHFGRLVLQGSASLSLSCLLGAFPPLQGQKEAVSREMTLSNMWIVLIQSFAFLSGYLWYHVIQYFYHCLF